MNEINFLLFPVLQTARLILRQLSPEDDKTIFLIRSNEEMGKYLNRPKAETIEDAQNFISKINEGIKNNNSVYWGVALKNNPEIVGTICLWNLSDDGIKAEIGFELLPKYQGRGIMREAVEKVIDFGLNEMKLKSIEGEVDPENLRSINLMKKFGFIKKESEQSSSDENLKTVIYQLSK